MSVPILARRDFRLLWAGGTVSALGSWLLVVAVPYQVYRVTGSTTATGLSLAAESLPALLVGPWAGVLVDRWRRVRVAVVADLAAAAAVLPILAAGSPGRIWLVYLALVAENLAVVFLRPATGALTPEIVGTGPELTAANSLTALTGGVLRLAGPALGAVLLSTAGVAAAVVIDAATYLVAAAATALIDTGAAAGRGMPPAAVYRQLRGGLRHLVRDPALRGLLTASSLFLTANAALTALLVPFIVRRLGAASNGLGYLIAGLGVGYVLGAAVNRRLPDRPRTVICASQAAVGACFLLMFHTSSLPAATVAAALAGVPGVILITTIQTQSQRGTPNRLLGRVGAAFDASGAAAAVLGAVLGPAVVAVAGLPAALTIISAAALASTAASAALLPNRKLAG